MTAEQIFDLEAALVEYRVKKVSLDFQANDVKALKKKIDAHILSTGEVADVEGVKITIRNGYDRKSWNLKGIVKMMGYKMTDPDIKQFETTKRVAKSVAIKVEYNYE